MVFCSGESKSVRRVPEKLRPALIPGRLELVQVVGGSGEGCSLHSPGPSPRYDVVARVLQRVWKISRQSVVRRKPFLKLILLNEILEAFPRSNLDTFDPQFLETGRVAW